MHQISKYSGNWAINSVSFPAGKRLSLTLALMIAPLGFSGLTQAANTKELTPIEMVTLMESHYNAAILSHDALIRGNLTTLRNQLAKIETQVLPDAAPQSWGPHHTRLREAARRAASVSSLDTAAPVMGAIAEACGTCHATVGVGKIYFWPAPPDKDGKLKTTMRTHQWATERLWEGVTGPFGEAWNRGAVALAKAQVFKEGDTIKSSLLAREAALRDIGQAATQTTGLHEQAIIYGRLLTTCAECHQEAGVSIKDTKSIPPWRK